MANWGNGTFHEDEIAFWDKSQEVGRLEVFSAPVTATYVDPNVVNFAAQSALWATFLAASEDMVLGLLYKSRWVNTVVVHASPDKADIDQGALREVKLMLRYIDATTEKRYSCTLPTLDLSKVTYLPLIGNDAVSLTLGTEMIAFVAAFQAFVKAPLTGNAVTIIAAEVVGRNN